MANAFPHTGLGTFVPYGHLSQTVTLCPSRSSSTLVTSQGSGSNNNRR
jgi:hypothetical protein